MITVRLPQNWEPGAVRQWMQTRGKFGMNNETKTSGVPKLNLAPRLTRPLSLWNPLDYLRLLYWVFYFPQAIGWYTCSFAQGEYDFVVDGWMGSLRWFRENPIQSQLWLQSCLLQIILPAIFCCAFQQIGFQVDWTYMALGIVSGIILEIISVIVGSVASGITVGIPSSILFGIVFGLINGIAFNVENFIANAVVLGLCLGSASGLVGGIVLSSSGGMAINVILIVIYGLEISLVFSIVFGIIFGLAGDILFGITLGMAFGIMFSISMLRLDLWLWSLRPGTRKFYKQQWNIPKVMLLPQTKLSPILQQWLQTDWGESLAIISQLQRYTLQFFPALEAVNVVLGQISEEDILSYVSQLVESPHSRELVKYLSASIEDRLRYDAINELSIFPLFLKNHFSKKIDVNLRLNTPARAAAAGFWYLQERLLLEAEHAFSIVENIPYGYEMRVLTQTLRYCYNCKNLSEIAETSFPSFPATPHLRPQTWQAITQLYRSSEDIRVVQQAASKSARAYASNRALSSLTQILSNIALLPNAEGNLVFVIAYSWRSLLLQVTGEIGNLAITKPVPNPYTIGDPVMGDRFIGRDDIMRQLEELWFMNKLPQSIVLYGHRRMGKTSILRNIATHLGADTRIAYINLNLCEVCNSVGEVLLTLTDELAKVTTVPKPTDTDLLNLPEITFRRYISAIANTNQKLIIILDEFETLETLISNGKISPDFLAYLRGLIQLSPTIAFAFAGLHTLEEMTADYFAPFFASILPVRVGFLDRSATRQLLANPDPDYLLDFAPDILDEAHALTNGQPYLIQLIGFHLTRHYNTQVFEQSRSRDAKFTLKDLTTILGNPDFYSSGRYYFTGVWTQAAEQHPQQQPILVHLAHHPNQNPTQISQILDLDLKLTQIALDTLKRHDVAHHCNDDRWEISIELFRRWIIRQEPRNT